MEKYDHGPLNTYEVIYTSGHVERVQAHQVLMPHDDFEFEAFRVTTRSRLEKRWTFHGEFDGHWRLVLSVPASDVKSVRNVTLTADDLSGGGS